MALSTKPNRFYPSIPNITEDSDSHTNALMIIKEAIETHERRNNSYLKSFVRFEELVDLGLITADGTLVDTAGSGGTVTVVGEDYLTLLAQEITANPIDLDNLSATGTPSVTTFLRGDNTWAVAGSTTLAALTDTDVAGVATGDLLFWNSTDWEDTAGQLIWDPTLNFLQLFNDHTINWLDSLAVSVELLEFAPAGAGDIYWDDVIYLAKWEGTDAATAYTELAQSDVQNFYGNAQLDTAQFNFGAAALLMDGTTDGVQSTGDTIFAIVSTDDATVEAFVRFASLPTTGNEMQLVNQAQSDVVVHDTSILNTAGVYTIKSRFGFGGQPTGTISGTPPLDTWIHFASVRRYNAGTPYVDIFWDGDRLSTTQSNNNPSGSISGVPITIGAWDNASTQTFTEVLDGHVDDVRITLAARYVGATYTIPTADFPTAGISDEFTVGDPGYVTNIEGSEVQINGTPIEQNATHTGEVTGATVLSVDVSAITNQTDVVADPADDVAIHDDSDGTLKKVNLSSITDGGYF